MAGTYKSLYDVAVDGSGNIFLLLYDGSYKIKKYSSTGEFISEYIPENSINTFTLYNNHLYFTTSNGLYKLDTSFNIISHFSEAPDAGGSMGIAVSDSGKVFYTFYNGSYASYIARISSSLKLEKVATICESFGPQPKGLQYYNGSLYTIISGQLVKFSPNFSEDTISYDVVGDLSSGCGNYFFIFEGHLYTTGDSKIYKYDLHGNLSNTYLSSGSEQGQVSSPDGIFIK